MLQFFLALFMVVGLFFAPGEANAAVRYSDAKQASKPIPVQNYGDLKKLTVSQNLGANQPFLKLTDFKFSGIEGEYGKFNLTLSEKPRSNIVVDFLYPSVTMLSPDGDGDFTNGTDIATTFTPTDWNINHPVKFVAEIDDATVNRTNSSSQIKFRLTFTDLAGKKTSLAQNILIPVTNNAIYNPDSSKFNIDLDFRGVDGIPYWTQRRKALAQQYANVAASYFNEEYPSAFVIGAFPPLSGINPKLKPTSVMRNFDDHGVFVQNVQQASTSTNQAYGSFYPSYGGGTLTNPKPRLGGIAIDTNVNAAGTPLSDDFLAAVTLHEVGHTLGLVGATALGDSLLNKTASPYKFTGSFTKAANGGADLVMDILPGFVGTAYHPANNPTTTPKQYHSAMSYLSTGNASTGGTYDVCNTTQCGYTALDIAMLKDHGYSMKP